MVEILNQQDVQLVFAMVKKVLKKDISFTLGFDYDLIFLIFIVNWLSFSLENCPIANAFIIKQSDVA